MSEGDVSTIFLAGLPLDALPRELENMMRFFVPGYEGVKIAGAKGGGKGASSSAIFVKFDHSENAIAAMKVLNNQPFDLQYPEQLMRVEMARSDMKKPAETVPRGGAPPQAYQPPPPAHAHPVYHQPAVYQPPVVYHHTPAVSYAGAGPPAKRQRTAEDAGTIDTVAIFGALEKGFTEYQLEEYFGQLPGYICFKGNSRNGGGFVKFASPHLAQDAIEAATQSGLECRMARTSMSSPAGDQGADYGQAYQAPAYQAPAYEPPRQGKGKNSYNDHQPTYWNDSGSKGGGGGKAGTGGKGGKRSGGGDGPSVDTLILQGVTEKGWTTDSLTDMFQKIPGYVLFKANPRVGGGFVKFTDPQSAMDAIAVAEDAGINAQMARSSMSG